MTINSIADAFSHHGSKGLTAAGRQETGFMIGGALGGSALAAIGITFLVLAIILSVHVRLPVNQFNVRALSAIIKGSIVSVAALTGGTVLTTLSVSRLFQPLTEEEKNQFLATPPVPSVEGAIGSDKL